MKNNAVIGRCKTPKHRIELKPEAVSHRKGAQRMSSDKAAKANQEMQNLLALGQIQPSYSPWASRIVTVKKKTGDVRICFDFCSFNDVTVKGAFPLPRIVESLSWIRNAKIITRLNLAWASWQIPLTKRDRKKTAFACEQGLFEWRRMPFGHINHESLAENSASTWHRSNGLYRRHCHCYSDHEGPPCEDQRSVRKPSGTSSKCETRNAFSCALRPTILDG